MSNKLFKHIVISLGTMLLALPQANAEQVSLRDFQEWVVFESPDKLPLLTSVYGPVLARSKHLSKAKRRLALKQGLLAREKLGLPMQLKWKPKALRNHSTSRVPTTDVILSAKISSLLDAGELKSAAKLLKTFPTQSSRRIHSHLEYALARESRNEHQTAIATLEHVLDDLESNHQIAAKERNELRDLTNLTLARILYEQKRYLYATKIYRDIHRDGTSFHLALEEQAWALFMAGYPQHSLGVLHSLKSPDFAKQFLPEAGLLEALVLYSLCRYEDSRHALATYLETYGAPLERTKARLASTKLTDGQAFSLLENYLLGISATSLGYEPSILEFAASTPQTLVLRERLALQMEQQSFLKQQLPQRFQAYKLRALKRIKSAMATTKRELGQAFSQGLQVLVELHERQQVQLEFLYVELLLGEKDVVSQSTDHVRTASLVDPANSEIRSWSQHDQTWKANPYNEFWRDELGFQIVSAPSQCNAGKTR